MTNQDGHDDGAGARAAVGSDLKEQRIRLGLDASDVARLAKVDRTTLAAIESGKTSVRDATLGKVAAALDQYEHAQDLREHSQPRPVGDPSGGLVEFVIEGNFGVRTVVRGPVRDVDALQEAVAKLIHELGNATGNTEEDPAT